MAATANGECLGWAARDPSGFLSPYEFNRRSVGSDDVSISILYYGVCNADVVWPRKELGTSKYPLVPGECEYCDDYLEKYCSKGSVYTFDEVDSDGTITKRGYSSYIVVHERYCFSIPEIYTLELASSLLCAGITVYNPMMRQSLRIIGLGGLGTWP